MFRKLVGVIAFSLVLFGVGATAQAATTTKTTIKINHTSIRLGHSATVYGKVSPNLHGHVVYLQRKRHGSWHSVAHHRLSKASWYSFRVRPKHTGTFRYRVFDPRTRSGLASSHSRTVTLTVRHRPSSSCTPGYQPCIPPGSDVDCAGGSGNGPRYVTGPIYVTGSDPYDLDRDGDGVACE